MVYYKSEGSKKQINARFFYVHKATRSYLKKITLNLGLNSKNQCAYVSWIKWLSFVVENISHY